MEFKLKFKREFAGYYIATDTYKGYKVEVTLMKFLGGGFGYDVKIDGCYSWGDGWIGLRKSDILEFIDQTAIECVDERIRYRDL